MKKIVKEKTQTVIDKNTGELIDVISEKEFYVSNTEPFFFTYTQCIGSLCNIKNFISIKILWKFMELCDFNRNEVAIPSERKKQIINDLGISLSAYNKSIKELVKSGIITGQRGLYIINEEVYWKGDKKTRDALIKAKMKVTFTAYNDSTTTSYEDTTGNEE